MVAIQHPPKHPIKSHNLPQQLTPFIGRSQELAEIMRPLVDPACRLLTLLGPGGIGKTRLAIQAMATVLDHPDLGQTENFANGVFFVNLQPVASVDMLFSAIADALNFSLSGPEESWVQLLNYLTDKQVLLGLDNFEHLLEGADLLADLLQAAPGVKLLVTSREALNLQGEWLYPVGGMHFPTSDQVDDITAYSAVRLFAECARRVRPGFSLEDEANHVVRICQLVEGMPLAIELAASWAKTLTCGEIATEIQGSLDFLASGLRNVPERHQSMQAVFEQTWQRLAEKERSAFMRLSVFQGGFGREAAEWVSEASLPILSALVDKSLLRWEPDGRYQIHELLRQYAAEQLGQSPEDVAYIYDSHCAYYANFLYERLDDVLGGRQREATLEIEAELENVRAAWQWAVELTRLEEIRKSSGTLALFCQYQCRYLEGANTLESAVRRLDGENPTEQTDLVLVILLVDLSWFYIRLGRLEDAEAMLRQCQTIYRRLTVQLGPNYPTDPALPLGIIASIRGDYEKAAQLGEQARELSEVRPNHWDRQLAYYLLARAALAQGQYETAQQYAQQAYAVTQEGQDRWFMAYCLNELGNVACALKDYAAAKEHYEASYALRQEFDDAEGMAVALNHLGRVAILLESYAEAESLYQQSLTIYQEINDRGGLATALNGLGYVAVVSGDCGTAREHLQRALQIAMAIQFVPLMLSLLIGVGELLMQIGQKLQGLELLALVTHHPGSEHETKQWAQRVLARYEPEFPPDEFAAVTQRGASAELEAIVTTLQEELIALKDTIEAESGSSRVAEKMSSPAPPPPGSAVLVEPLTARELEVLQLIAEGLTNQQMAAELVISVGTVKWYTGQIYSKLNVNSRTQAVARARELKLIV